MVSSYQLITNRSEGQKNNGTQAAGASARIPGGKDYPDAPTIKHLEPGGKHDY